MVYVSILKYARHTINTRTRLWAEIVCDYSAIFGLALIFDSQLSPGQKLIYCDLLKSLGYLLNFLERNPMPKQKSYITTCELLAKNLSSQSLRGLTVCALSWPSLIDIHALQPIESDIISRSIFLHYGVVLYMNNNKWYTHGAGQRMMKQMMWNSAETPFEELNSIVMWMRDIIES